MNSHRFAWLALAAAAGFAPSLAQGQAYWRGYDGGYHASTAAEGYARGAADLTRAQGQRNLANSEAAINRERARSDYIDNRVKATNAYWERKRIYEENMAPIRYERNKKRQARREKQILKEITPEELDPTTGVIDWPSLLEEQQYEELLQPLDELFRLRGQYGALKSEEYLEAKDLIRKFRAAVTANRSKYPDAALRNSLRFLLKLDRELDNNFG